jgi:hypothetical protein
MLPQIGESCSMKTVTGIIALSLLAVAATIFPGAVSPTSPSAGCPEHRQPAPLPSRNSSHHESCQAGHQSAILREVTTIQLSTFPRVAASVPVQTLAAERLFGVPAAGTAFPDRPPSTVVLRI